MVNRSELNPGEWLLLTAGASAFGKFAIQVAKHRGIKIACTVRHDEQKDYLAGLGADLVINTEKEDLKKVIADVVGEGVSAVFDAVGGELGAKALSCLKQFGTMYVLGGLSMQRMP